MKIKYIITFLMLCLGAFSFAEKAPVVQRKVLVKAQGTRAVVSAMELHDGVWTEVFRTEDAYVGRNGLSKDKREGDGATPEGTFEMRRAFGLSESPKTALPYTLVQPEDVWVDDVNSPFYNQYVSQDAEVERDWKSCERLASEDVAYKYVIVIEYNTDTIQPGAGSAIFLHCSKLRPTAGCVSVPEEMMVQLLEFLRPGDQITIEPADE